MISVKVDASAVIRHLNDVQKRQLPFIMAKSLTMTAGDVQSELKKKMPSVFDRPNRWTFNALFKKGATKSNLTASVGLKDEVAKGTPAFKYLSPQIFGGARRVKRFERALQAIGAMPKDMISEPTKYADIDAYGNMRKGQIVQILKQLRGVQEGVKGRRVSGNRYVAIQPGARNLPAGIWLFKAGDRKNIKPIMLFVKKATYQKRWAFFEGGKSIAENRFHSNFLSVAKSVLKG